MIPWPGELKAMLRHAASSTRHGLDPAQRASRPHSTLWTRPLRRTRCARGIWILPVGHDRFVAGHGTEIGVADLLHARCPSLFHISVPLPEVQTLSYV